MRNCAAFRLTGHVLIYSAFLTAFNYFRPDSMLFGLVCAAVFVCAFIAVRFESAALRLVIGLLPGFALLYGASTLAALLCAAPPVLYCAAFLAAGRFDIEVWQLRRETALMIVLVFFAFLATMLGVNRYVGQRLMAPLACVSSILALRSVRAGRALSCGWQAGNALIPFAAIAAGALLGYLLYLATPVFKLIAKPVAAFWGGFMVLWTKFWGWIMGIPTPTDNPDMSPEPSILPEDYENDILSPDREELHEALPIDIVIPWGTVFIVLAAVLLIIIAVILIRRGSTKALYRRRDRVYFELEDEDGSYRRRRRRRAQRNDPREQLRAVYRRYLSFLSVNGIRPRPSETTEDISRESSELLLSETDELLRALYRRARYSAEPVTREEVAAAEAALDRLMSDENVRKK